MARALLLLALLAWFRPGPTSDPLARLATWTERAKLAPTSIDARRQGELRAILGDLRLQRAGPAADEAAIDAALVALAAVEFREEPAHEGFAAGARLARAELEQEYERDRARLGAWLAHSVVALEARRPRAERRLALELLATCREESVLPALRAAAQEDDAELAQAAASALVGWPDERVHELFLTALEHGLAARGRANEHFAALRAPLPPAVAARLEVLVARLYLSDDWREAARARALVRALGTPQAAPILIEALALWDRRTREGTGSKRIRFELVSELQRRSGRALGAEPERWSEWWQGVRAGRVLLPEDLAAAGGQPSTATFFGLHAESDRVLFVVDRSGSMKQGFGTGGSTRYEEAIEQLLTFLRQSGGDTRFTVALFSDDGVAWRTRLAPASEANLDNARRWLESKEPDGETMLYEGVRAGLGLDARRHLNVERCEIDTVIVLCDGATTEGPGWVAGWLARENEAAQLVFHCVQIGTDGNGTLEALARGTGGEFVRVQG